MKKNILMAFLVGLLLLGFAGSALGQGMQNPGNPPDNPNVSQSPPQSFQPNPQETLKAALGILVIDGVMQRDQALKVLKYFAKRGPAPEPGKKPQIFFDPLVRERIINRNQARAIEQALQKLAPPQRMPGGPNNLGNPPANPN